MDYEVIEKLSIVESALAEFIIQTSRMFHKGAQETHALRNEMKEFKDEMKEFKNEMRGITKDMNKKWGELANKLGTFAEDIAAPNLKRVALSEFGCSSIDLFAPRLMKKDPNSGEEAEFDTVVIADDKVFLLETKSTIRMEYIERLPALIESFRRCFPEYAGKTLIPVFASMNIPENIVKRLSKLGFYAMAMGDDTMDILNLSQVKKSYII